MPCGFESHLSHQKSGYPIRGDRNFLCLRWDSKARPERSEGIKQSGGLFYRAWGSPSNSRRIRYGCGLNLNMSDAEKALVRAHFSKSPIRTLAPRESPYRTFPLIFCKLSLIVAHLCATNGLFRLTCRRTFVLTA